MLTNLYSNIVSEPSTPANNCEPFKKLKVPTIINLVCTFDMGCKVDQKLIACSARNAEFNPKRFSAVVLKIANPKSTGLIFKSGKVVLLGAKSEEFAYQACRTLVRTVNKIYDQPQKADLVGFKIQNIVAKADTGFSLRLELFAKEHKMAGLTSYEPELFPGLIFRVAKPKVTCLIFNTGRLMIMGAKNRLDLYEAYKNIYPLLYKYQSHSKVGKFDS